MRRSGGTGANTGSRLAALAPSQQGQFSADGSVVPLRRLATPHLVRLLGDWRSGGTPYPALAAAPGARPRGPTRSPTSGAGPAGPPPTSASSPRGRPGGSGLGWAATATSRSG